MASGKISIDRLIELVKNGATVKTGVDVYNKHGVLLLERDIPVSEVKVLEVLKANRVSELPIKAGKEGGVWDAAGTPISLPGTPDRPSESQPRAPEISSLELKLKEIAELKVEAAQKYNIAKANIRKVLYDIKRSGGEFDYGSVEENVTELLSFVSSSGNAFSYLTKELFSYDDYLYNHAIQVCTIGTAVLNKFNRLFTTSINRYLTSSAFNSFEAGMPQVRDAFTCYLPEEMKDMSMGFFIHDIGKVMIPQEILNKKGRLTKEEFGIVRRHSFEKGMEILDINRINNPYIRNIIKYHHAPLFGDEEGCYPLDKSPHELPLYVKICKLADIYDAMTSKRSYKEAVNPISVVTKIFRTYTQKDQMLQFIMHSFVKSIGIYPPGSIASLRNGQLGYILDSRGPIVIPVSDIRGRPLSTKPDPIELGRIPVVDEVYGIDNRKPLVSPAEAWKLLPEYLKTPQNP